LRSVQYGKQFAMQEAGFNGKQWLWSGVERLEHDGFEQEGVRPLDYVYVSETGDIKFPGDPDAPIGHTANCACDIAEDMLEDGKPITEITDPVSGDKVADL